MKIVAAFAYRYEPEWLVDQLRENLSWVDGFAELDTRGRSDVWMPRGERVAELQRIAKGMGADWILHLDPDERLEDGAEAKLREVAESGPGRCSLRMRELWTPDAWRSDGVWGDRWRRRFYHVGHEAAEIQQIDVTIYHLKMIEPANRAERARVHTAHNTWDNRSRGFGYMTDESQLTLEPVPAGRGYSPPYKPYAFEVG